MPERENDRLRQAEEHFRLLVESVRDYAIFMLDPRGTVTSWNPGAERIKGWRADEIVGQHFSRFYPQEALQRGWPAHELAVALRDGRFEDEGWRVRKDGTTFWANVVITPVHDDSGTHLGFAKVTRDLSERREVETLREDRRRTSEFLAMLGHELRNPLAPIRNAVAILRARDEGDPTATWAHGVIERQVGFLGRMVDDLLDVSRIATGKVVVRRVPLDLAELVRQGADNVRPLLAAKQQHLELDLPPGPVPVAGDAARLAQVVSNLLTNASKYTPAGGHVRVELEVAGDLVELRVRDDGMGIPPHLLPCIFDLFTQGDRALDRAEGGLGIGLTVVHKLVELHGGSVTAHSEGPGKGSLFRVRLPPLAASLRTQPAADGGEPVTLPSRARVLVVDDNVDAAETVARLLEAWGCQARTAHDGATAVGLALADVPDLVLLDIGLPGMDGYEVARRLTAAGSPARLVAMTGYGQPEDRQRALDAGFVEHLVKPVEPGRLRRLVERLTRARGA